MTYAYQLGRELALRSFGTIMIGMGYTVILPWFVFTFLMNVPRNEMDTDPFHIAYLGMSSILLVAAIFQAQEGLRRRLFTMPVSTWFITLWLCVVPAIVGVAYHLGTNGLYQVFFGSSWPWIRPAITFALSILFFRAFYLRLLVGRRWELFLWGIATLVVGFGLFRVYSNAAQGQLALAPFSVTEIVFMIGFAAVSVMISHVSVKAGRADLSGSFIDANDIAKSVSYALQPKSAFDLASRSPTQQMAAVFWRANASAPLIMAVFFALFLVVLQIMELRNTNTVKWTFVSMPAFLLPATGGVFGAVFGRCVRSPGQKNAQTISTFLSSRPVSNNEIWFALTKCLFWGSVWSWIIIVGVSFGLPLLLMAGGQEAAASAFSKTLSGVHISIWLIAAFFATMGISMSAASVILYGRDEKVAIGLVSIVFAAFSLLMAPVLLKEWTGEEQIETLCASLWLVLGVIAFAVTAYSYYRGIARRLIDERHLVVALIALLIIESVIYSTGQWLPWHLATGAMIWMAVSIGLPLGPMAIDANRHR